MDSSPCAYTESGTSPVPVCITLTHVPAKGLPLCAIASLCDTLPPPVSPADLVMYAPLVYITDLGDVPNFGVPDRVCELLLRDKGSRKG